VRFYLSIAIVAGVLASATTAPPQEQLTFKDIKPILDNRCVACHGSSYPGGELRLDSYAGLMKGGEHGKAVVPKNSAGSRLIKMLKGTVQPRMPMDKPPLPKAEIEKISKWIAQGAKK
jgi:hypothetical protein